jgi:hypothetical protein
MALLQDGRVCVDAAPWFAGDAKRAAAAVAEYECPLAEVQWQGRTLVESRLVRYAEHVGPPPFDLDAAAAAARATAGW